MDVEWFQGHIYIASDLALPDGNGYPLIVFIGGIIILGTNLTSFR
jgi:hypothetical protein